MLGWRCYNAADRHFKPIYRQVQPEYYKTETGADPDETNTSHARMFHDLIVYREVYDCGKRKGLSQRLLEDSLATHQAAQSVAVPAVEAAMGSMIQRSLLGMQAFASGEKTPEGWLRQFGRRHQQYYVDIHRFARGAEEPPPNWLRRFILDNNFYDRRDPLLRLARALHEGKTNPVSRWMRRWSRLSGRASTPRRCVRRTACSEFFERRIDEAELRPRLDLGAPHFVRGGKK